MITARYKFNVALALRGGSVFYKGRFVFIKYNNNNLLHSRVGVIISRKTLRLATARNEIKRIVYRFFQENKQFLDNFSPPSDFLIIILAINPKMRDNKEDFLQELKNVILI